MEQQPTFKVPNLEIFCDEKLPNFEHKKLFEIVNEIQEQFFEDFGITQRQLETPLKLYLFRTREKWMEFNEENKNQLSSFCLDRQFDYNYCAEDIINSLIPKLLYENFKLNNDNLASKGITRHYCNLIYFKNNYDYLNKHWFLKTIGNETVRACDKKFIETVEAEFVANYLLELGESEELFEENAIQNNIQNAIKYYREKYKENQIPKTFDEIETVEELICFLDKEVTGGWLSQNGEIHIRNYKNIHELNISQTPQEILKNHVATCADYAIIVDEFLKSKGFETKIFYVANYDTPLKKENNYKDLISSHYRVFYKSKDGWTQVETASQTEPGEKTFQTLGDGLTKGFANYFYWKNFEMFEIPSIKSHYSFVELYDSAKQSKPIKFSGESVKDFKVTYEENLEQEREL